MRNLFTLRLEPSCSAGGAGICSCCSTLSKRRRRGKRDFCTGWRHAGSLRPPAVPGCHRRSHWHGFLGSFIAVRAPHLRRMRTAGIRCHGPCALKSCQPVCTAVWPIIGECETNAGYAPAQYCLPHRRRSTLRGSQTARNRKCSQLRRARAVCSTGGPPPGQAS